MAKLRVLVVDDYPGARYFRMRSLLDDGGFDVAEESLGRQAVLRTASERFDLLVLDIHLPDIDGFEVCRSVRANPRTAKLPILMMSAVSDLERAERESRDAGASAFLHDTPDSDVFLAAVRQVLGTAA